MKLSFAERLIINSPLRAFSLRFIEPAIFARIAPFPRNAQVLDLGCGNGTGLIALAHRHNPASLTGVDVDADQLVRANRKLSRARVSAKLVLADAIRVSLPAHTFDAITCSVFLHRLPNWKNALTEASRLLQHGGMLYAFENYRTFSHAQLQAELPRHGFTVLGSKTVGKHFGFTVARRTGNPGIYD